MEEESYKSFYDNTTWAFDLHQPVIEGVDLVSECWHEDDDDYPLDELVVPPASIYFGAEAGGAYAWNEDNSCITISFYFEDHPRVNEIRQIEKVFGIWSWWYSDYYLKDDFPWDASEVKEKELAGKLAEILADTDVKIIY